MTMVQQYSSKVNQNGNINLLNINNQSAIPSYRKYTNTMNFTYKNNNNENNKNNFNKFNNFNNDNNKFR